MHKIGRHGGIQEGDKQCQVVEVQGGAYGFTGVSRLECMDVQEREQAVAGHIPWRGVKMGHKRGNRDHKWKEDGCHNEYKMRTEGK